LSLTVGVEVYADRIWIGNQGRRLRWQRSDRLRFGGTAKEHKQHGYRQDEAVCVVQFHWTLR